MGQCRWALFKDAKQRDLQLGQKSSEEKDDKLEEKGPGMWREA